MRHVIRGLKNREHGLRAHVSGQLLSGIVEIKLNLLQPLLEDGNEPHAAVDGVAEPGLGLVGQRVDGVFPLRGAQLVENLGDIASAEHLVDVGKFLGLVRWEVRREHALLGALPPEKFAGCARRI